MATLRQPYLFTWKDIEASSDLDRLRLVMDVLPDEEFMRYLENRRGRGRNDYPIRPTWNAILAGIVFQHEHVESLRRELKRNAELRYLCGFDPFAGDGAVPSKDAFSHLLALIIENHKKVMEIFHKLVEELRKELPDLGAKLAVDSKAIRSYGRPVRDEQKLTEEDGRRDTDADWGKKTYKGKRKDGTKWEKVVKWFGYKLHLLVDSKYELPLEFKLTKASRSDSPELLPLVEHTNKKHPDIIEDAEELSADKGYDSSENNRELYDGYGIKPVIDKRTMWKDGELTRPLFPDRSDSFIYDEDGNVSCICFATGEQRSLFFSGFEKDRKTLKYRCPAAAWGFECAGRKQCEARVNVSDYGRVIRVPLEFDTRIFTPIARHIPKWKKSYNRRTAVERVNSRIDMVLGFEKHYIRGQKKMETRITLGLIVMLAMALGRIKANQREQMRSLTAPVKRAA